jgi:hypothetical protein
VNNLQFLSGPAGAGGTAACDDALVSYGLAVWDGDRPLDDDQAGSTYDELYERYLESVKSKCWPAGSRWAVPSRQATA